MCGNGGRRAGREDEMGLMVLSLAGIAAAVLTVRSAAAREGFLRAAVNGILGLAALLLVNISSKYTGIHLGFNVFNGVLVGVLGVPGVILLVLIQWVLT